LKLVYPKNKQEIAFTKNFLVEEMIEYIFREYLVSEDDERRTIAKSLRMKEMKRANGIAWDDNKSNYLKLYQAAITEVKESNLEKVAKSLNLDKSGKAAIAILQEEVRKERTANANLQFNFIDENLLSRVKQNPQTSENKRQLRNKGLPQSGVDAMVKLIKIGPSKDNQPKTKTTSTKNTKTTVITEIKSFKFKELEHNKVREDAQGNPPEPNSKTGYLHKLGYRPINLVKTNMASSKQVTSEISGGKAFKGAKKTKTGEREDAGFELDGKLSSDSKNNLKEIFESMVLNEEGMERRLVRQEMDYNYAIRAKTYIENLLKLSKPLEKDIVSIIELGKEKKKGKKKGEKEPIRLQRKKLNEKGDFQIATYDEILESQMTKKEIKAPLRQIVYGSPIPKLTGEEGKLIREELLGMNLKEFIEKEPPAQVGGKNPDKKNKEIKIDWKQLEETSNLLTGGGYDSDYEYDDDDEVEKALRDYQGELMNIKDTLTASINNYQENIKQTNNEIDIKVESKIENFMNNLKTTKTTTTLPKELKTETGAGKKYLDPKTGKEKTWNLKDFNELLESGFFGPKAKEGTKEENLTSEERRRKELEEATKRTKRVKVPIEEINKTKTNENAREFFKAPKAWFKSRFAEPLSDLDVIYTYHFIAVKKTTIKEKIVDGKKQKNKNISYDFERAKLIPVYDITTKTPNPRAKDSGRIVLPRLGEYRDANMIRSVNNFANSIRSNLERLESGLLRGVWYGNCIFPKRLYGNQCWLFNR